MPKMEKKFLPSEECFTPNVKKFSSVYWYPLIVTIFLIGCSIEVKDWYLQFLLGMSIDDYSNMYMGGMICYWLFSIFVPSAVTYFIVKKFRKRNH